MTTKKRRPVMEQAAAFGKAFNIMMELRDPGGCHWDQAQTHESLLKNLLEEAYEFVQAVRDGDVENMREELGDLLLQVIFHAQIAGDRGSFDFKDTADELSDKLIRRHPHVFGEKSVDNPDAALASWHEAKRAEGKHTVDLHKVPRAMPSLMRAKKIIDKAGKVGFEWGTIEEALAKLDEEQGELKEAIQSGDMAQIEDELGDVLFMTACVARYTKTDPELALSGTIEKFLKRWRHIESRLAELGKTPEDSTLEEMDKYWDEAKGKE